MHVNVTVTNKLHACAMRICARGTRPPKLVTLGQGDPPYKRNLLFQMQSVVLVHWDWIYEEGYMRMDQHPSHAWTKVGGFGRSALHHAFLSGIIDDLHMVPLRRPPSTKAKTLEGPPIRSFRLSLSASHLAVQCTVQCSAVCNAMQ